MDAFRLTDEQVVGLWANMPRLEARRARERWAASGTRPTWEQLYECVLAETGKEEEAQRQATEYVAQLLQAGEEVR